MAETSLDRTIAAEKKRQEQQGQPQEGRFGTTSVTETGAAGPVESALVNLARTQKIAKEKERSQMSRPELRGARKEDRTARRTERRGERQDERFLRGIKSPEDVPENATHRQKAAILREFGPFSDEYRRFVAGNAEATERDKAAGQFAFDVETGLDLGGGQIDLPEEEEEVDVVDPVEEVPEVPEVPRVSGPGSPEQTVTPAPEEPALDAEVAEAAGVEEAVEEAEEAEVVDTPETEAALEAAGVNETDSEQEVATKTDKVVGDESPVETEARRGAFGPVEGLTIPELRRQYRSERQAAQGRLGAITADNAELMQERAEAIAGTKQQMRELKDAKRNVRRTLRGKGVPSQGKGNIFQSGREAAAAKALADAEALEAIEEGVEDVADSAADAAREGGAPKPKAPAEKPKPASLDDIDGMADEELADFDLSNAYLNDAAEVEVDKDVADDVPLVKDEESGLVRREDDTFYKLLPNAAVELKEELIDMTGSDELYNRFINRFGTLVPGELERAVEEDEITAQDAIDIKDMYDRLTKESYRQRVTLSEKDVDENQPGGRFERMPPLAEGKLGL